jgi:hypothetical protein
MNKIGKMYVSKYIKFQRYCLCHITGDDIRSTRGTSNATMASKTTKVSKVTLTTMWSKGIIVTI